MLVHAVQFIRPIVPIASPQSSTAPAAPASRPSEFRASAVPCHRLTQPADKSRAARPFFLPFTLSPEYFQSTCGGDTGIMSVLTAYNVPNKKIACYARVSGSSAIKAIKAPKVPQVRVFYILGVAREETKSHVETRSKGVAGCDSKTVASPHAGSRGSTIHHRLILDHNSRVLVLIYPSERTRRAKRTGSAVTLRSSDNAAPEEAIRWRTWPVALFRLGVFAGVPLGALSRQLSGYFTRC